MVELITFATEMPELQKLYQWHLQHQYQQHNNNGCINDICNNKISTTTMTTLITLAKSSPPTTTVANSIYNLKHVAVVTIQLTVP